MYETQRAVSEGVHLETQERQLVKIRELYLLPLEQVRSLIAEIHIQ